MKNLGTEFKVGLFALVALVTLGYMFFVLSPDTFENKEYRTYYTVLRSAAGIVAKSHVKTSGVGIGKVKSVALEGTSTRIVLEVDMSIKVPTSSRIEIRSVGLLGDVHLEVVRGADTGQYVEDGGFIPQSETGFDMNAMFAMAGEIAKDFKVITKTLAEVLGSEDGKKSITNTLKNLEQITEDIKVTTGTVKSVVGGKEDDFRKMITDVRLAVQDLRTFSGNLKDVVNQENRDRIDRILSSFDETMVDVRGSAKNINLIAEKVEKGEGTIGKLVNDDKTISELESAIKDVRKILAPANKLAIDVDYHGEFRRNETTQHYFNILFRTRPDRFYLIGLTDTAKDVYDRNTKLTRNADGSTTEIESVSTKRAIKFNAQIAKRWYFTTIRFGLFETSGGIASDFHFLKDKITATVEAFDWDTADKTRRRNAHLKAYASALFYNHIYAMAGVDDPTRTDPATGKVNKEVNFFVGGGLTFNDQDLKAVLGTAALAR